MLLQVNHLHQKLMVHFQVKKDYKVKKMVNLVVKDHLIQMLLLLVVII